MKTYSFPVKDVEVSAICDGYAISPDADVLYTFRADKGHCWYKSGGVLNPIVMWNVASKNKFVHRGIFTIKVAVE